MGADAPVGDRRVLTIPNLISLGRLACVPVFLWLLFDEAWITAAVLLAVLGATDWVDGWIARRYNQGSELGKVLDPVADRILLIAACAGLLIDGTLPIWVGVVVLVREALISAATLALAAAGAARIDVQWTGKASTLALMVALPGFLFVRGMDAGVGRDLLSFVTWCFTLIGLGLSYYAAAGYIPIARRALREGRAARATQGAR